MRRFDIGRQAVLHMFYRGTCRRDAAASLQMEAIAEFASWGEFVHMAGRYLLGR